MFNKAGIPNFLVAQCICLIEGNLISQKETQLEDDFNNRGADGDQKSKQSSRKDRRKISLQTRIQHEHSVAVALLTEIWTSMPSLFSNM